MTHARVNLSVFTEFFLMFFFFFFDKKVLIFSLRYFMKYDGVKGTIMQIEKVLINDCVHVSKVF